MEKILEKYDITMQQYSEKIMPHFYPMIDAMSRPYQESLRRVFDFYLFTSYLVDSKFIPNTLGELDSLKVLYSKSALSVLSVYQLLSTGLIEDASVILRSLLECKVTLKVLLEKDTLNRIKLYSDYSSVAKWLKLKRDKEYLSSGRINKEQFDRSYEGIEISEIERKYELVKNNYHSKTPYHWAWNIYKEERSGRNPSLEFICKKLGLEDDYDYLYSTLSIFAHSDSISEVTLARESRITVAPRFSGPIVLICFFTVSYMVDIIQYILDYFKPEEYEEIKIYSEVYRKNFMDSVS